MKRILPLLVLSVPLLWSCDDKATTGTNDETTTSLAVIYRPDGKPAAGARVAIYAPGDTQATPRVQGIVDDAGHVSLSGRLAAGSWNLLVRDAGGTALFQDSLPSDGSKLTVLSDTLRRTGTVKGRVRVQPQDKPTIAWVQLIGAGRYANVDDSGYFAFDSVPSGRMTLVARTLQAQYTPTFRPVVLQPDSVLDLGMIDLIYTGVPMVTGLAANYDTASGVLRLHWDRSTDSRVVKYTVMDIDRDSPSHVYERVVTDTFVAIHPFASGSLDTAIFRHSFRVAAADLDDHRGNGGSSLELSLPSPFMTGILSMSWTHKSATTQSFDWMNLSLDTLGGGLVALQRLKDDAGAVIDAYSVLRSTDGVSWTTWMSQDSAFSAPKVWNGRLWKVVPHVRDSLLSRFMFPSMFGMDSTGPRYDSAVVFAALAGGGWSRVASVVLPDSINKASLEILDGKLCLLGWLQQYNPVGATGYEMRSFRIALSSLDGKAWKPAAVDSTTASASRLIQLQRTFVVPGPGRSWTFARGDSYTYYSLDNSSWIRSGIPGSRGTAPALPTACASASFVDAGASLLLIGDGCSMQAQPSDPTAWKYLEPPHAGMGWNHAAAVWNGKIVSISDSGVYIGSLSPR